MLTVNGHVFRMIPGNTINLEQYSLDQLAFKPPFPPKGLYGDGYVSFESVTSPGQYICNRGGTIMVMSGDMRDQQFLQDCSFKVHEDKFFPGYERAHFYYKPETISEMPRFLPVTSPSRAQTVPTSGSDRTAAGSC